MRKSRILTIILSLLIVVCFTMTACNFGSSGITGGPDTDNNGDNNDNGNEGGGDGNVEYDEIENADILALSYDRLENADLSFNFDMNLSESKVESYSGDNLIMSSADAQNDNFTFEPDEIRYWGDNDYNIFKSYDSMISEMSRQAREIVDFVIDNVTVMNKVVVFGAYSYYLSYDAVSDAVLVYYRVFYGDTGLTQMMRIKVYYDESGDEVVEADLFEDIFDNEKNHYHSNQIVYCADKYYSFKEGHCEKSKEDFGMYNTTVAYRDGETGEWRGLSYSFNADNPYLTKDGIYDYANGQISLRFLFENDGVVYEFSDLLIAYKNGEESGSGVAAEESDLILPLTTKLSVGGTYIDLQHKIIDIDLKNVKGWDSVTYSLSEGEDYVNNQWQYFQGKDYIKLSNGISVSGQSIWNEDDGWAFAVWENQNGYPIRAGFVDIDGNEVNPSDINSVTFNGVSTIRSEFDGKLEIYGFIELGFSYNSTAEEIIENFYKFFEINGLSLVNVGEAFANLGTFYTEKDKYTTDVYEYIYGCEYSYESIVSVAKTIVDDYALRIKELYVDFDKFETIDYEEMPELPENTGLINLSGSLNGKAVFKDGKIDFSGINIEINKTPILSTGSEYEIYVALGSTAGSLKINAFNSVVYNKEKMIFKGISDVELPQINNEGEFALRMFFAKKTENAYVRLSEFLSVPIEPFDDFSVEYPAEGGKYIANYSYNGTEAVVSVEYMDMQAPELSYKQEPIEDNLTITADEELTIEKLLSDINAVDNIDGEIKLSHENLTLNGTEVEQGSILNEGTYTLKVSDKQGNTTEITINVIAAEQN